jgi:Ser/Thr protein kinase RdoA (MazF antagonist)
MSLRVSTSELHSTLERLLPEALGRPCRVGELRRRPSSYRTSFPLEELDVALTDGTRLELVMKDGGRAALREDARLAKPGLLYDPVREIEVYRGVLAPQRMGTARYYGSVVDAAGDRYRLFIERVRGVELYQVVDLELWKEAARWLGRAHSRLAALGPSAARGRLVVHDADYFARWFDRALELAASESARRRIERLGGEHGRATESLLAQPPTVIHGEFYASNVLVSPGESATRVCPIDWEVAGYGPGVIDVAALTTGWDPDQSRAMEAAYRESLTPPYGAWSGTDDDLSDAVDWARLHLAIRWLGWAPCAWTPPAEHRRDWLAEAEALADRLGG